MSSARTRSMDRPAAMNARHLAAVAGRQHDALDAERAQLAAAALRCRRAIRRQECSTPASSPSTATATATRAGRPVVQQRGDAGRRRSLPATKCGPPTTTAAAVDPAGDAFARRLGHLGGDRQRQAARARLGDDGLRDDVLGGLVERGGEPQQLVGARCRRPAASSTMRAWPCVSVPVLSITSARTRASVSSALPPLIRMPSLAARERPETRRPAPPG